MTRIQRKASAWCMARGFIKNTGMHIVYIVFAVLLEASLL